MINTILASVGFMAASALAQSYGSAIVINQCSYDVYLANTPSAGGGYNAINEVLSSGGSYSQPWTELSNGNGWSLKLSKDSSFSNIMQYEYTFQDTSIIWFDLSDVNGNPWNADWEITATGDCTPRQAAYQYATDDAYGMQSCPSSSSVTVTLCSAGDGSSGGSTSPAETVTPTTTTAAATTMTPDTTTSEAPVTTEATTSVATTTTPNYYTHTYGGEYKVVSDHKDKKEKSTLATVVTKAGGVTVTNVKTVEVTQYVTATAHPKRHEHHAHHAHHHF